MCCFLAGLFLNFSLDLDLSLSTSPEKTKQNKLSLSLSLTCTQSQTNKTDAGGVDDPISRELLGCVHTLSPNETELARLLREDSSNGDDDGDGRGPPRTESDAEVEAAARLLLSRSPASLSAVLVKRGGKGSMLVERGGGGGGGGEEGRASSSSPSSPTRVFAQPAARVAAVVDTTGAGDCFTAAYCVSWLREGGGGGGSGETREGAGGSGETREGDDPEQQKRVQQRLRFATAAAALCVSRAGALPSMPSLAEVESFLVSEDGLS